MSIPMDESRREKSRRLARQRMDGLLKRAGQLCNLASSSYEFTPEETKQLVDAAYQAAHSIKHAFDRKNGGHKGFQFE